MKLKKLVMSSAIAMMAITGATTATTFAVEGPDGKEYTFNTSAPEEQKNETLKSLYEEAKTIFGEEKVGKVKVYVRGGGHYTFDLNAPLEKHRENVKPNGEGVIDHIEVLNSFS